MTYNFQALTTPPSPEVIKQYIEDPGLIGRQRLKMAGAGAGLLFCVGIAVFALGGPSRDASSSLFAAAIAGIVAIGFIAAIVYQARIEKIRSVKLTRFAKDNGFDFAQFTDNPLLVGMFFNKGNERTAQNIISGTVGQSPFELGNYKYAIGSGRNRRAYSMGYVRIQLERHLPHMVLDSAKNNSAAFGLQVSNLPAGIDANQRLKLEGDFNEHFTLYVPKGYEKDALYVFTPDLMALLIDTIAAYDVEIIDDQCFIYLPKTVNFDDPAVMQDILKVIEVVGQKTINRTDRYVDDRLGDATMGGVGIDGQRLR